MNSVWVCGYPSYLGGADTELLGLCYLWRRFGVEVNLVPCPGFDPKMKSEMDRIGCVTHDYQDGVFRDHVVVSLCNGEFLKRLPRIVEAGKPAAVVWFNCMTFTFADEVTAHRDGLITHHGFVSSYQRSKIKPELERFRPVVELEGYRPYYDYSAVPFRPLRHDDHFAVGRISRDDPAKFSTDTWNIFDNVLTPRAKKVHVLGFSDKVREKIGEPPSSLDFWWGSPGNITATELYSRLHCLIHKTGGSRESYGRFVIEAAAHGVPVVVENDYAFPDLISNGVTGYTCNSSDEMSFRASELAFNDDCRMKIITAARDRLGQMFDPMKCWEPWAALLAC